ncbi:thioesterase family protein [Vagococcus salmoninarum]|uniref:thioesterase family protein n=1 Tax=Vagococcus salmoninarum TaxID=2739 RepID=UPI003F986C3D
MEAEHTAQAIGSGDLAVLGTPALLGFVEITCNEMTRPFIAAGETTVGISVQLDHQQASKVGGNVVVHVSLLERVKQIVTYDFTVCQGEKQIARGSHQRAVVDTERFLSKLEDK